MPKENQEASFQKAWQKNVRVMSWIITSDDPVIWINLRMYETTKEMCNCLKSMQGQDYEAVKYNIGIEINDCDQQDKLIQEYYLRLKTLILEYGSIVYARIPKKALSPIHGVHERNMTPLF